MQEKVYNKGDIIIREGELGNTFYQIISGSVDVITDYEGAGEKKLSTLGEGKYFGEMAVLEGYPRSATVIAAEDGTKAYEIPGNDVNSYFEKNPEKILGLFCHIGDRLRALTEDYKEASDVLKEMEADDKPVDESLGERMKKVLSKFFGGKNKDKISAETMQVIEESTDFRKGFAKETVTYQPGTVIFREGEPGRCMYAVHWGRVGIYSGYGTDEQKKLADIATNQFFGEMGMIEGERRSATAVALENDTTLEIICSDDLAELFEKNPVKVSMILSNLSYRLRRMTIEYNKVCSKIKEKQG